MIIKKSFLDNYLYNFIEIKRSTFHIFQRVTRSSSRAVPLEREPQSTLAHSTAPNTLLPDILRPGLSILHYYSLLGCYRQNKCGIPAQYYMDARGIKFKASFNFKVNCLNVTI